MQREFTHFRLKKLWSCFFSLFMFASACYVETPPDFPQGEVKGFKPIYGDSLQAYGVVTEDARPLSHPGKIYIHQDLLLVNEVAQGVHVIDNADPENPQPLYFIKIPGNVDVAMKGNVIFADNYEDMVLIKLNADGVEEVKRIRNAIQHKYYEVPPSTGYFECVDRSMGYVVDWEETTIRNPKCYH